MSKRPQWKLHENVHIKRTRSVQVLRGQHQGPYARPCLPALFAYPLPSPGCQPACIVCCYNGAPVAHSNNNNKYKQLQWNEKRKASAERASFCASSSFVPRLPRCSFRRLKFQWNYPLCTRSTCACVCVCVLPLPYSLSDSPCLAHWTMLHKNFAEIIC